MTTTIGELCMGYGGLGMGLSAALGGDTRVAWAVEYDKHPSAIIAHRYPGVPNYGDVKTTDWAALEPVDWLTAGYPCQPFSLAGLRKGADDPRHLWPGVARAIRVLRPRNVLLENVAAHLRLGFDTVLADLADLGYAARWGVVRASDAGAPHGRARLFVVARHTDGGHEGEIGRALRGSGADTARVRAVDAADTDCIRHERGRSARGRRPGPADCDLAPTYPTGVGRGEGRTEPAGLVGRPDAALGCDPDDDAADTEGIIEPGQSWRDDAEALVGTSPRASGGDRTGPASQGAGRLVSGPGVEWGAYGPAVARWAAVTGRPAPRPTEPGRNGERLSPRFVEWLMGLPDGWVTDVPGLPRNAQLKALGNGVVPQQAALACRLLGVASAEEVAA